MKKKIIKIALSYLIFFPALFFSETKIRYISPDNNGVQDELVIPLKISDKRLITAWQLIITDENGATVRTIGNKVALPEKLNIKSFFKQIVTPKVGVEIPETVSWNGAMDNGETAPDGTYFYYFTATDDNGNVGETAKYTVVVDTQAPKVDLAQPNDKIFGEGAKSELKINQSGSKEDLWTGTFKNALGETVRTFTWKDGEPESFKWNGKNDLGSFVPDGVYSYEVTSTDRAGNTNTPTAIQNIIYSAEKPATNILISGSRYFSAGTESPLKNISFEVTIPVPEVSSGNKLTAWSVSIVDANGNPVRVYNQNQSLIPPSKIVFDGKDSSGNIIPQGIYHAEVSAAYLNGYEPVKIKSPEFVLDVTKPNAQLIVSDKSFGGETKRNLTISMLIDNSGKFAKVPQWTGSVVSANDEKKVVKSWNFGEFPPESVVWNGFDSEGKLASDGEYKFVLTATDLAGNTGVIPTKETFAFSSKEAKILLSIKDSAFNPNGSKARSIMEFIPVLKDADGISDYTFTVQNSRKTVVKNIKGNGNLPSKIEWNGKNDSGIICEDGKYNATLKITSLSGSQASVTSADFDLDTVSPSLKAVSPWAFFSPEGDGNQDVLPITITDCTEEELWTADVKKSSGKIVRKFTWKGKIRTASKDMFEWDGTDESGNKVPDGTYSIVIHSEDRAGNSFSTALQNIVLDTRETKIYLTADYDGISPNGDGKVDSQIFRVSSSVKEGILSWKFDVRSENGASVRSWSNDDSPNLPAQIIWDGLDSSGKVAEGTFSGTLSVVYKKGNKVDTVSSPFVCTAIPPILTVQTAPEYFSPDNDGSEDDLFIKLSGSSKAPIKEWSFVITDPYGKPFWTTGGKTSITERMVWDGLSNVQKNKNGRAERVQSATDYPYNFTVSDTLGMTTTVTGKIRVDVLVIRDGSVLKMAVPSIIFRSDAADFNTTGARPLSAEQARNNEIVLNRIAEILNKFKDYRVTIVGHANRLTDNEAEETTDNPNLWGPALQPLSAARAEYVKQYLVKKGINAARLTTEGKGGSELVVDFRDKDNNWKNRRVEFILEK